MQWTEQAMKASLDGTWTKVHPSGRITHHRRVNVLEPRPAAGQSCAYNAGRCRKYWSDAEDKLLVDAYASGQSYKQIGVALGRTEYAIHNRLYKLAGR